MVAWSGFQVSRNVLMPLGWGEGTGFFLSRVACHEWEEKNNSKTSHKRPLRFPTSHKWQSHKGQVGNQNGAVSSAMDFFYQIAK